MKKIAYIELDAHAEIAVNFMELIAESAKISADFYFSDKIATIAGNSHNLHIIKVLPKDLLKVLKKTGYDLVIIGTVHRYFNVFQGVTKNFPTAVICHNLNFVKAVNFVLFKNIFYKDLIFRLKLIVKEGLMKKNWIYKNAKELFVLDENLANEKFKFLPIYFNKLTQNIENEKFTVVIPGTVEQKRRDYKRVLNSLHLIENQKDMEIIFLGKAKKEELNLIKKTEKLLPQKINFQYFTEKIAQNIFDDFMQKADCLWCPVQEKTEFFSIEEIYGKTKMSGNIGDAVKFGKFAFFPNFYVGKYDFILSENQIFNENFANFAKYDFTENFSKNKVLKKLEDILIDSLG